MNKNNLNDIFSDLNSESSVILPKSIKIKDITSSFMPQKGGYSDATSSFMPQKGGYLNGTKNKDINQLMSMLSTTSENNSTDNTEQLKDQLYNILQEGGSYETLLENINRYSSIMFTGKNQSLTNFEIKFTKDEVWLWKNTCEYIKELNDKLKITFLDYLNKKYTEDLYKLQRYPMLFLFYNKLINEIITSTSIFNLNIIDNIKRPIFSSQKLIKSNIANSQTLLEYLFPSYSPDTLEILRKALDENEKMLIKLDNELNKLTIPR